MSYIQPTAYRRRLAVSINTVEDTVMSLQQLIIEGLTAAVADLFDNGTDDPQKSLDAFTRSMQGWKVVDGYIEHGSPDSTDMFYLMTNFLGSDADTGEPFPYPSAVVIDNGIAVGASASRHYFGNIQLKDVLIYCAVDTVKINLDIQFQ